MLKPSFIKKIISQYKSELIYINFMNNNKLMLKYL